MSSLSGLSGSVRCHWFGWPGIDVLEKEKDNVREILAEHDAVPLFLPKSWRMITITGFRVSDALRHTAFLL